MRQVQDFFAEQMRANGQGNTPFRFEADASGEPLMLRVDGQHPTSYYITDTVDKVLDEIDPIFDLEANVYYITIDNADRGSISHRGSEGSEVLGVGSRWSKVGGFAMVPNSYGGPSAFSTIVHELGHAFGLSHDFRDSTYVMSYGYETDRLSACNAEFLAVHPYFNANNPLSEGSRPLFGESTSSPIQTAGATSIPVRTKVRDPDGLHQAILFAFTSAVENSFSVKACRGLEGRRNPVVEFDYDGMIPSEPESNFYTFETQGLRIGAVDALGDYRYSDVFELVNNEFGQVQPARPHTLTKVSGAGQEGIVGAPLARPFVVSVLDQNGAAFAGAVVTFSVTAGGGTLSAAAATTDANGQARSTLTLGSAPGTNTVTATVAGLEPVTFTATATEQVPPSLTKLSGDNQAGAANTQLAAPLVVAVLDQQGAPLPDETVTFAVTAGAGLLSSTTDANIPCLVKASTQSLSVTTDANGRAATRLTLGDASGTNAISATVARLDPVAFTATATEQATPHRLTKVCGDSQEGTVSTRLTKPLVVSVLAEDGAALAGVVVSFSVSSGGGGLSATTATTNANGRARTWLTLGSELGTNTVSATVAGIAPETFTATGQENPLASLFDIFGGSGKLAALPDRTQLLQNAPNPFNSQTVVSYFLLEPGPVRLEVFALSGQRVAVLHQGRQQAGYHRLHWDGRDAAGHSVASGAYLYRLMTDEAVWTRKLILLR